MEEQTLSKEQELSKNESLVRAEAFYEIARTQGFLYMKSYYENKLRSFVNELINKEEKSIEDFESERREVIGLKKNVCNYRLGYYSARK
jgi:hypothetical protein